MAHGLLEGLRVLDLGGDPSARAARVLGDLGADVVRVVPPGGDPLPPSVSRAWNAGKQVVRLAAATTTSSTTLLAEADVVFDEPGEPGAHDLDPPRCAPQAVWVRHHAVRRRRARARRGGRPTSA